MDKEFRIIYMQVEISEILMKRWGKSPKQFVELDKRYDILWYIRLCYEPFHLTGDDGIVEEVEKFIEERGGSWQ